MDLRIFELPPIGTNAYLLVDLQRAEAVAVDAPLNAFATVEKVLVETGCRLTALLMTHGHWDHLLDGHRFNAFDTPVYGHVGDQMFFEDPAVMASFAMPGMAMEPTRVDLWVTGGATLELLGQSVEVRHVPGHSPGSVLYYWPQLEVAFSGDVVFAGSVGRTDFPGCSFEELATSIRRSVYTLPDATTLFPGHGPRTTVGQEAGHNTYVTR